MRTVHRFLWGSFRVALKVALEEMRVGRSTRNTPRQERGWKLFLLLPRMLLHHSPRGDPISRDTLRQRPDVPRKPVPELPRDTSLFNLPEKMFSRNVRSAKRGTAAGPSGMTCDHLRPLLDSNPDMHLLFVVGELFSRGQSLHDIVQLVNLGRMTALRKKDGGVRGIVAGEVIRRLVARTITQQLNSAAAAATAPFQYALTTRAGCECVSHVLQAIYELDENATVTSIDVVSAYDTISRWAMLQGLERVPEGGAASPLCDCSTPNRQRTPGKMMMEWFTQSVKVKAGEQ